MSTPQERDAMNNLIYTYLKSSNLENTLRAMEVESQLVFDEPYLLSLIHKQKLEEANDYLSAFIKPSVEHFNLYNKLYAFMFLISLKEKRNIVDAIGRITTINPSFVSKVGTILHSYNSNSTSFEFDFSERVVELAKSMEEELSTPKYNYIQRTCPAINYQLVHQFIQKQNPSNSIRQSSVQEISMDEFFEVLLKPEFTLKRERDCESEFSLEEHESTLKKQKLGGTKVVDGTKFDADRETNPINVPPLKKCKIETIAKSIFNGDATKSLLVSNAGTFIVMTSETKEIKIIHWHPTTIENKEIIKISLPSDQNVSQAGIELQANSELTSTAILTTPGTYMMLYDQSLIGSLYKMNRDEQIKRKAIPPKKMDVKVLLGPKNSKEIVTAASFLSIDNNYLIVGFSSGNVCIGRVDDGLFDPKYIYSQEGNSIANSVYHISYFVENENCIRILITLSSGRVVMLICAVEKKSTVLEFSCSNRFVELANGARKAIFHPSGKYFAVEFDHLICTQCTNTREIITKHKFEGDCFYTFSTCGQKLISIEKTFDPSVNGYWVNVFDASTYKLQFDKRLFVDYSDCGGLTCIGADAKDTTATNFYLSNNRGDLLAIKI